MGKYFLAAVGGVEIVDGNPPSSDFSAARWQIADGQRDQTGSKWIKVERGVRKLR